MSNAQWDDVARMMQSDHRIQLSANTTYLMNQSPGRAFDDLNYYKFAAKMIGVQKQVLDVSCAEGLGTWLLATECGGYVKGLNTDPTFIDIARRNWSDERVSFETGSLLTLKPDRKWNAIVAFNAIEQIQPMHLQAWWEQVLAHLADDGIAIVGIRTEAGQNAASELGLHAQVNTVSHDKLIAEMEQYFNRLFNFAAYDEVIQMGYLPLAQFQIVLACHPKLSSHKR